MRRAAILLSVGGILMLGAELRGQNATVQQPAFGVNSVSTTVSVPDRGGLSLGGVGRGAASRSQFGPFPSGYAAGSVYESSVSSAHVFIHDLRAMDRAVLESAPAAPRGPMLAPRAEQAYRSLLDERRALAREGDAASVRRDEARRTAHRAARHYRLGVEAQERGAVTLARLHFQAAARCGSAAAEARLAELESSVNAGATSTLAADPR